jgi:hypothetical protein
MIGERSKHISIARKYTHLEIMKATTSTPMLWTEMTDDLSETVNGGGYNCHKSYYYCEKPKKKEKECEYYYEEPSKSWEKQYDYCSSYKPKCW